MSPLALFCESQEVVTVPTRTLCLFAFGAIAPKLQEEDGKGMWHGCWSETLNDMENLEGLVVDLKRML